MKARAEPADPGTTCQYVTAPIAMDGWSFTPKHCDRPAVVKWWPCGVGPIQLCRVCYERAMCKDHDPALVLVLGKA